MKKMMKIGEAVRLRRMISPKSQCLKKFQFEETERISELDKLKDKIFKLREDLRDKLRKVKRTIKYELIES